MAERSKETRSGPQGDGGSVAALLDVFRDLPDVGPGAVDELEKMIALGRLHVVGDGIFDWIRAATGIDKARS